MGKASGMGEFGNPGATGSKLRTWNLGPVAPWVFKSLYPFYCHLAGLAPCPDPHPSMSLDLREADSLPLPALTLPTAHAWASDPFPPDTC